MFTGSRHLVARATEKSRSPGMTLDETLTIVLPVGTFIVEIVVGGSCGIGSSP